MASNIGAQQPIIEGMPEIAAAPPVYDLAKHRMSVARLLRPETHGFDEAAMMAEQTPAAMYAVWPERLYPNLFGKGVVVDRNGDGEGRGKRAVLYETGGRYTALALSATERLTYSYNLHALGNRTEIRAEVAKDGKYAAGDLEAPRRAGLHAVEERVEQIGEYIVDLNEQQGLLKSFTEALEPRHVGLARLGSEAAMRAGFNRLHTTMIANMLSALEDQRGWSVEQRTLAESAILARLLADRQKNRHLKYAAALCDMLISYGGHKLDAFSYKKSLGESYILDNSPKTIG